MRTDGDSWESDRSFGIIATANESALLGTKMVGTKKDEWVATESAESEKKEFFLEFFQTQNGQTNSFLGDTGEWVDARCVE
jgi:hypothetical protein